MTQAEFDAVKATFPWREQVVTVPGRVGGLVRVLDNTNGEVPLFTITKFLAFITQKLTNKEVSENE